ncbi:hypothetical protein SNEBB_007575 [Seison nebaliae]|nr:hypothetical protein SNEBB_007575 [Seison nebaliae]
MSISANFAWLREKAPMIPIASENIRVIEEPRTFYDRLKSLCEHAKKRISFASLYVGDGELEEDLFQTIDTCLKNNSQLKFNSLLDYTRSYRINVHTGGTYNVLSKKKKCDSEEKLLVSNEENEEKIFVQLLDGERRDMTNSTIGVIGNLVKHNLINDRVKLSFYHTPNLRGWKKRYIPNKFNEVIGLQHMKIYLVDNSLIISGANLSETYFHQRQDRYIEINSSQLANYFDELISIISSFSIKLNQYHNNSNDGDKSSSLTFLKEHIDKKELHPFKGNYQYFINSFHTAVQEHIEKWMKISKINLDSEHTTFIYPCIQAGLYSIQQERAITSKLLEIEKLSGDEFVRLHLASGYLNLTTQYEDLIVRKIYNFLQQQERVKDKKNLVEVITSSPKCNGFYEAKGILGYIPEAYTVIEDNFLQKVEWNMNEMLEDNDSTKNKEKSHNEFVKYQKNVRQMLKLSEYEKNNWTFHAKGIWLSLLDNEKDNKKVLPFLTTFGSTNFGSRSVERDLECSVILTTEDKNLQNELGNEIERYWRYSHVVNREDFRTDDRYPTPFIVIRDLGGKLMLGESEKREENELTTW